MFWFETVFGEADSSDIFLKKCLQTYSSNIRLSEKSLADLCRAFASNLLFFNIVSKKENLNCERTIVLLGENHLQGKNSFDAEKRIASSFRVVAMEGISGEEVKMLKNGKAFDSIFEGESAFADNARKTKSGAGSMLTGRPDRGLFFGGEGAFVNGKSLPDFIGKSGRAVPSENWVYFVLGLSEVQQRPGLFNGCSTDPTKGFNLKFAEETFKSFNSFIDVFGSFVGHRDFPVLSFIIEVGPLDTYDISCEKFDMECMRYTHTERNKRFAKNLETAISKLSCNVPILLVVGSNHIGPISRLMNKRNYTGYEAQVGTVTYEKSGRDPAFPND